MCVAATLHCGYFCPSASTFLLLTTKCTVHNMHNAQLAQYTVCTVYGAHLWISLHRAKHFTAPSILYNPYPIYPYQILLYIMQTKQLDLGTPHRTKSSVFFNIVQTTFVTLYTRTALQRPFEQCLKKMSIWSLR